MLYISAKSSAPMLQKLIVFALVAAASGFVLARPEMMSNADRVKLGIATGFVALRQPSVRMVCTDLPSMAVHAGAGFALGYLLPQVVYPVVVAVNELHKLKTKTSKKKRR